MTLDPLTELFAKLEHRHCLPEHWAEQHPESFEGIWARSDDAEALIGLGGRVVDRRLLSRAACACAKWSLQFGSAGTAPRRAIAVAEAWCQGDANAADIWQVIADAEAEPDWAGQAAAAAAAVAVHDYPFEPACSAVRNAADVAALHAIREKAALTYIRHDDPDWLAARAIASSQLAALVREYVPCPSLDQLREAFEREP